MSREMLTELRPASSNDGSERERVRAFVVRAMVRTGESVESCRMIETRSGRSRGSPPVRRILVTPRETKTRERRRNSGGGEMVRRWWCRGNGVRHAIYEAEVTFFGERDTKIGVRAVIRVEETVVGIVLRMAMAQV